MKPSSKTASSLGLALVALTLHSPFARATPAWTRPLINETLSEATPEMIEKLLAEEEHAVPPATPAAFEEATHARVQVLTFRMPKDCDYEFSLLIVDQKIRRAFIVSTSIAGKVPILGIHRLTPLKAKGLPWPWIKSIKYDSSPMYWGINIRGGYFIHSTPHYGNLGRPASMGCIRVSIPDAMEVFNTVANEFADVPAYSLIYQGTSLKNETPEVTYLKTILANSNMTIDQLKAALALSRKEILAMSKGDFVYAKGVPADAHARPFTHQQSDENAFPRCGGSNCWEVFHKKPTIVQLSSFEITGMDPATIPGAPIAPPPVNASYP
jgi:hypothetical protein